MNEQQKSEAAAWFSRLQDDLCALFEAIEDEAPDQALPAGRFERKEWSRPDSDDSDGGGGTMAVMRGRVFEKIGVNVSVVHGRFSGDFSGQIAGAEESGGRFWAAGLSLVAHPCSPLVPAAHMNTRMIATSKSWCGGGGDLTPTFVYDDDSTDFHQALKEVCEAHPRVADHARFKAWCDDYFFLPHRNEARGIGGIFFDQLASGDWQADFAFLKDVGTGFGRIYSSLVRRRMSLPWTGEQRRQQLVKRGRYVEFNLLYDRGTTFGLKTGGNVEAILMSLPPAVIWP